MKDFISKKNYRSVSVEKWSTEFGIQEIDESQIATVKRWRSLKSADYTKMRLTVKLKINMLPDLVFLQLYFIILVMWELFPCLFGFSLLCRLYTDKFTSVQIGFFPYFSSWVNLSLILNLNSVKQRQFKVALALLLLDKNRKKK